MHALLLIIFGTGSETANHFSLIIIVVVVLIIDPHRITADQDAGNCIELDIKI